MKKMGLACAVMILAAGLGCNNSTPGGGGSHSTNGTATTEEKTKGGNLLGPKDGQFNLKAPDSVAGVALTSTAIKQGESKKKDIGIARGKGFDQDVDITFEGLPQGVTVEPAKATLKHGEDKVTITLKTAEDAALGKATVKIVGKPAKEGDAGTTDWTINVEKK